MRSSQGNVANPNERRATTLTGAAQLGSELQVELHRRDTHSELFKCCEEEFITKDLFHAMSEAGGQRRAGAWRRPAVGHRGTKIDPLTLSSAANIEVGILSNLGAATMNARSGDHRNPR